MNDIRTRNAVISQGLLGTPDFFEQHRDDLSLLQEGENEIFAWKSYAIALGCALEQRDVWNKMISASALVSDVGRQLEPMYVLLDHSHGLTPPWSALDVTTCDQIIGGSYAPARAVHQTMNFADFDRALATCESMANRFVEASSCTLIFALGSDWAVETANNQDSSKPEGSEPLCPRSLGLLFLQRHAVPYATEPEDEVLSRTDASHSVDLSSKALGLLFLGKRSRRGVRG